MDENARVAGKRVLVTGTGGGQGACAQELFCEHGAQVVGCDVQQGAAEATAERLRSRGFEATGECVDLSDPEAAAAWVHRAADRLGGIDVVYNNASAPRFAPFGEMSLETWRFVMTNELDIVFHVTSPAWRYLVDGGGSVINTASAAATTAVGRMGQAAHSAAKAGVVGLTRQLAAEGAPHGVRVNSISPGFVLTAGTAGVPAEVRDWMIKELHLLDRPGTPEEIARLALYLASDESGFVTGADLAIDGGWSVGSP